MYPAYNTLYVSCAGGLFMKKKECWKRCVRELIYCRPRLNRKLLCMRTSFDDVCKILNSTGCHDHEHGGK